MRRGKEATRWGAVAVWAALCAQQATGAESTHAVAFDCVMEPARIVKVGSPVAGILEEVAVRRGEAVGRGDVIARLRSEVERASVEIARMRAASTELIDAARSRVELTRKHHERAKVLWKKKAIPAITYEEIEAEHALARNELARVRQEQRLADLELRRSTLALERHTVRSPFEGTVIQQALAAGEFVRQDRHIVTIAVLAPLHVEVFLPVEWYPNIETGKTAAVEPAPPIGGRYDARIIVVDRVFDAASGSFGVRLTLPNADGALPAGHRCKVTFASEPGRWQAPPDER